MSRVDFGAKPWVYPMPVLIVGTIDPKELKPIGFDPVNNTYFELGEVVGKAFGDGLSLKT